MKPRTTQAVSLCKHDHTVFILPNCRLLRSDQRTTPIGGICRTLIRTFRQLCLLITRITKPIITDTAIHSRDTKPVEPVPGEKRGKRTLGSESKLVRILTLFGTNKESVDHVLDSVRVVSGVAQFLLGLQPRDVEGGPRGLLQVPDVCAGPGDGVQVPG